MLLPPPQPNLVHHHKREYEDSVDGDQPDSGIEEVVDSTTNHTEVSSIKKFSYIIRSLYSVDTT